MKREKEPVDVVALEVKALSKTYRNISRDNIRILHEFCEFDYRRTNRVVCMADQLKNPASLIEAIIKKPEFSEELLADLERKYEKQYGVETEVEVAGEQPQEEGGQEVLQTLGFDFFAGVPGDCVLRVMQYLDPYSLVTFWTTGQQQLAVGQSEAMEEYYKAVCLRILRPGPPPLPADCRFHELRAYVFDHPNQYGPNIRNAVGNNLREYVWGDVAAEAVEASYYKAFGSYHSLFLRCPRIHFNGYYVCREKYVRIGEKCEKYPVAPIHVVYYYRYFRFFPDGSLLYHVRSKRLKPADLALLSLPEAPDTIQGEYVQHKDRLWVKAVRGNTVFSYEMQIRSQEGKISNELKILKYTLDQIENHQDIKQILYAHKPNHEDKVFEYCHSHPIADQTLPHLRAASL